MPERLGQLTSNNQFGLAGMQQRVEAMGGTLTIESQPGNGTRLLVNVPTDVSERRNKSQVTAAAGIHGDFPLTTPERE